MRWSEIDLPASGAAGLFGVLLLSLVLSAPTAHPSEKYKNLTEYDGYFLKYSNRYFGTEFDWRCFKAQAIVESKLRPDVQSQDGAMGIMQIRPKTFREITLKNPHIWTDPKTPRWNIAAGIYYNRLMWDEWQDPLTMKDRINFMLASYNAGKLNILRAKQTAASRGLNPRSWKSVERVLSQMAPGQVTVAYVLKVNDAWTALQ